MNRKLVLFALACAFVAVPLFAASYVVPPDDAFIRKSETIVVAHALHSHVVDSVTTGIETVTDFSVSEVLVGYATNVVRVHVPGGVLGDTVSVIGGAPTFVSGADYLLFLNHRADGDFGPVDFGLGVFAFSDEPDRRTVWRSAEVFGWDRDGSVHLEFHRDADAFLDYIRAIRDGHEPAPNYILPTPATMTHESLYRPTPILESTSFTGTSYMLVCGGGGEGCRWNGFPVNWNQGNSEPGAPGTPAGKQAITAAFSSWNGAGVGINYVYASSNANLNGPLEQQDPNTTDHVNNIVFEKDLSSLGFGPYSCGGGGLLGYGGITRASGTHLHNGETYVTTLEGDVSMNQGIANCTTLFNSGDFNTAVAHELGHTLGLRHADQTRSGSACSGDPTLDCSNTAIMKAVINHNLSGALQTWDKCAVTSIYGSGSATPSITAQPQDSTIASGNQGSLSVSATSPVVTTYQWYVGASGTTTSPVVGGTTASIQVSPTSTTQYWVRITGCGSTDSATATITVTGASCTAAAIGTQPTGSTITQGSQATLSVTATGTAPFGYQWYVGSSGDTSSPVAGGTTASIQVSPSSTTSYWVKVTNSCNAGGANSNAAIVTVNAGSCTAPQITSQPTGSTVTFGNSAQLSVTASGTATLTYQWYVGAKGNTSNPVFNATTATINVNLQSTTSLWVRVTNSCGTADSNAVTVTVNCLAPQISASPASQTITQGSSTIFSATATGGPNMTFQWYRGTAPDTSTPVPGQTGSSITVSPVTTTSYWVQASVSGCGTANSNTVTVTVNPNNGCSPVTITTPTVTQNGASYTLAATASTGPTDGPITITWYQQTNSGQLTLGTGTSIVVSPTQTTTYLATATNKCNSSNSATVTVTIGGSGCTAPTVTQPGDQTIVLGSPTTITVTASGSPTLHYQWYQGNAGDTSVPVGTDAATLTTASLAANGAYWVKVTNGCGTASSTTVTISVVPGRHRAAKHH